MRSTSGSDAPPAGSGPAPSQPWRVRHAGFAAPGRVELFQYEEGEPGPGCFRVRTLYSGVSSGTELTHFQGTNPYLQARWDERLQLFRDADGRAEYPLPFSGYMQVGRVEASRAAGVRDGALVAMSYGHKTGHTARAAEELFVPLPPGLDPVLGIYVAQMGPICVNGILHADEAAFPGAAQLFGAGVAERCVLVCGTGVVGLLTGALCRWAGACEVAVAGRSPLKLEIAAELGLIPIDTRREDVGVWAKERWHDGAGGRGAHVAFQCTGAAEMLHQAFRGVRPQAPVIDLGFYQNGAAALLLGREFHHNGLRHISAQIYRVPPSMTTAWDRRRMAAVTLEFLRAEGKSIRDRLITHTFPFERAQEAFELLAERRGEALQVVLQCD